MESMLSSVNKSLYPFSGYKLPTNTWARGEKGLLRAPRRFRAANGFTLNTHRQEPTYLPLYSQSSRATVDRPRAVHLEGASACSQLTPSRNRPSPATQAARVSHTQHTKETAGRPRFISQVRIGITCLLTSSRMHRNRTHHAQVLPSWLIPGWKETLSLQTRLGCTEARRAP